MEICRKCSKNFWSEESICPHCGESVHAPLFCEEKRKKTFNFTGFCIFISLLPFAGLLLGIIHQSTMVALGGILGFWGLIYLCLWLMCAVDCFQAKDGTGFLLLLLLPVLGLLLVVVLRER